MFKSLCVLALVAVGGLRLGVLFAPATFSQSNAEDQGTAAFDKIATVLQSPRCVNCSPAGNASSEWR